MWLTSVNFYGNVIDEPKCKPGALNHLILVPQVYMQK